MNIEQLSKNIIEIHQQLQKKASAAVNISLTIRNWFIGYYIVEYEQKGEDRAKYGKKLIRTLSKKLQKKKIKGMSHSNLNVYRKFYLVYPQIVRALPEQLRKGILPPVAGQFESTIIQTVSGLFKEQTIRTVPEQFQNAVLQENTSSKYLIPPEKSITKLSFSHLEELIKIENPLKRAFYEIECISGTWSTRELQRQIGSLYYERSGLSKDKRKLSQLANNKAETMLPVDIIKNPMTFEFLNFPVNILLEEEHLEKVVCSILERPTQHGAIAEKTQNIKIKFYNLDAIIAIGYRVNSNRATQFRIWATKILQEYIIKGYTMDVERLKNPQALFEKKSTYSKSII